MAEDPRVTVRISADDLRMVDTFVASGEFRDRSEVIRRALKDFLNSRAKEVLESLRAKQEFMAEVQALQNIRAQIEAQLEAIDKLHRR